MQDTNARPQQNLTCMRKSAAGSSGIRLLLPSASPASTPPAPFQAFVGASDMLVMSHLHDVVAAENTL